MATRPDPTNSRAPTATPGAIGKCRTGQRVPLRSDTKVRAGDARGLGQDWSDAVRRLACAQPVWHVRTRIFGTGGEPAETVFGDIDGDGAVDTVDLLVLLAMWGPARDQCELADLDLDGEVGVTDLLELLSLWG